MLKPDWDFQVRRMDMQEYLVVFPNKSLQETFIRLSEFKMSLYKLSGKLLKTDIDPKTFSVLQTIWIKIHNMPGIARDIELIKEITALVAKPLVVDELSLVRIDAVRVQARCRNPSTVNGELEFFINEEDIFFRFEVEQSRKGSKGAPPALGQGPSNPGDRNQSRGRNKDNFQKDEGGKRGFGKFDRIGRMDREFDSTYEDNMEETLEQDKKEQDATSFNMATPIAVLHPTLGMIDINQMSKGMTEGGSNSCSKIISDKSPQGGSLTKDGALDTQNNLNLRKDNEENENGREKIIPNVN